MGSWGVNERHANDKELASMEVRSIKEMRAKDKAWTAAAKVAKEKEAALEATKVKNQEERAAKAKAKADEAAAKKEALEAMTPAERAAAEMAAPTVGDTWEVAQAKKATALRKEAQPGTRNRFDLGTAPESKASAKIQGPHYNVDAWEMQCCTDSKKHTQGAVYKEWVGKPATWTMEDQNLKHLLKTQTFMKGKDVTQYQGIKPKIPVNEYRLEVNREQQSEIAEANKFQSLPAPTIETDSWLFKEAITPANKLGAEIFSEQRHLQSYSIEPPSRPQPHELFDQVAAEAVAEVGN